MMLKDRVAVITGAGRGIGYTIAETFGQQGAQVVVAELVEERGREAAEKLRRAGCKASSILLDVTDPEMCRAVAEKVVEQYGHIDVLVNNAGLFQLYKSEEMPTQSWLLQINVMLNGVFFMTQEVANAAMIPQRNGVVVNIASIGGMGGWPMRSAYNAAKAGVIVLTEVLATEWAQYNIRLNCVSPGVTKTDMMDSMIQKGLVDVDKYARRTPLGRVAEPREIAQAVLFLASDRASFITGENLRADGGWVPYGNLNAVGFPELGTEESPDMLGESHVQG
jgi:NAD(P)-dependent dehydrogenase (short-subunit alcohol dehydrogenase family)